MTPAARWGFCAIALTVLAGCTGSSHAVRARNVHVLNWFTNTGGSVWVTTLDPATVADAMSSADIQLINANLVRIDSRSLTPVPDLATWTSSSDHRVWTFTMRPDARFSNGDPVTARDAAWSLTRALLPATRSTVAMTYLGHIVGAAEVATGKTTVLTGVSVVGPRTLHITLDAPVSYFLAALAQPPGDVLDRRIMQGRVADDFLTNTCTGNVGAGPFRPICRGAGSDRTSFYRARSTPAIDLKPNAYFYGHKPSIRLHLPFLPSTSSSWTAFQTGLLDGAVVPSGRWQAAHRMPDFLQSRLLQTDSLVPDMTRPPFDNVNCRLAVAWAIDRRHITQSVLHGAEGPLYGVTPPGLDGSISLQSGVPGYDPSRAMRYLARCPGHLNGTSLTYDSASPQVSREYVEIRRELEAVGAHVVLRGVGFHDWLNLYSRPVGAEKPPTDMLQFLWIADYPDAQDWCQAILRSGANFNLGGYSSSNYDRLVDQAALQPDATSRSRLYEEAQRLALRSGAWIAVGYAHGGYVVNRRVHGMEATAYGVQPRGDDWSRVTLSA